MLVCRLYRSLFRITRSFEKKSALKAFVSADRSDYYDRNENKWVPLDNVQDSNDEVSIALRVLANIHCSSGMFWSPNSTKLSLSEMVRYHFREKTSSVGTLNQQQRIDLAFSAFRYLSRCLRLGTLLSKMPEGLESLSPESGTHGGDLHSSKQMQAGSLLIAHPMLYQTPLTQSIILIINNSIESGTLGLVVNSPMDCSLGTKVPPQTLRDFPYLTVLAECELYNGGDVIFPQPLALIHQVDSLSHCSQKITPVDPSIDELKGGANNNNSGNKENSTSGALYYTQDLRTVCDEILADRARAQDFKCIIGCAMWGKGQLQGELDMNSWFLCEGKGVKEVALLKVRISASAQSEAEAEAEAEKWGQDMQEELRKTAMDQEGEELQNTFKIIENLENLSERDRSLSDNVEKLAKKAEEERDDGIKPKMINLPTLSYVISANDSPPHDWGQGHQTWQKVLRKLGGDYAPLAEITDLTVWLDKTAWKDLTALSLYGVDDRDNT